ARARLALAFPGCLVSVTSCDWRPKCRVFVCPRGPPRRAPSEKSGRTGHETQDRVARRLGLPPLLSRWDQRGGPVSGSTPRGESRPGTPGVREASARVRREPGSDGRTGPLRRGGVAVRVLSHPRGDRALARKSLRLRGSRARLASNHPRIAIPRRQSGGHVEGGEACRRRGQLLPRHRSNALADEARPLRPDRLPRPVAGRGHGAGRTGRRAEVRVPASAGRTARGYPASLPRVIRPRAGLLRRAADRDVLGCAADSPPVAYQEIAGARVPVDSRYALNHGG